MGKLVGFLACLSGVVYSYGGVQNIALLAGETHNPRINIPKAAKRIFYRVLALYLVAIFYLTLIVPYNNTDIANSTGNASHSPFVIAFSKAGIKVLPSIFNAVVLTSAWSEADTALVQGSRYLYSLAAKHQAPQAFLKSTKNGIPWVGVLFVALFIPLAYMTCDSGAANVFAWFQNLTSSFLLVGWILISLNQIHLDRALKAQGYSREELPWHNSLTPIAAWISLVASIFLLLIGGFTIFIKGEWSISGLISAYAAPVVFILLFAGWKTIKHTKTFKPEEVNLKALFQDVEDKPETPDPPLHGWRWITLLWS